MEVSGIVLGLKHRRFKQGCSGDDAVYGIPPLCFFSCCLHNPYTGDFDIQIVILRTYVQGFRGWACVDSPL